VFLDNYLADVGNFSLKLRSPLTVRLHPTTKAVSEQPPLITSCQQLHFPISFESLHLSLLLPSILSSLTRSFIFSPYFILIHLVATLALSQSRQSTNSTDLLRINIKLLYMP